MRIINYLKISILFPAFLETKWNTQASTHTSKRATTMDHERRTADRKTNCHESLSNNTVVNITVTPCIRNI